MAAASPVGWWSQFEAGVKGAISQWTGLRLAAENQWGGSASGYKAAELSSLVLSRFRGPKRIYADDLEDLFDDWFQNELHVILEDGSIEEVSALLAGMRDQCEAGDFRTAMRLCASRSTQPALMASREAGSVEEMAPARVSANRIARAQQVMASFVEAPVGEEAGDGEDMGEDGEQDEGDDDGDDAMDDVEEEDGEQQQEQQPKTQQEVDMDDGWTVVDYSKKGHVRR